MDDDLEEQSSRYEGPIKKMEEQAKDVSTIIHKSVCSWASSRTACYSFRSFFALVSCNAAVAILCFNAFFSFGSVNTFLSVLSINSGFSILSINSFFAIGCVGETFKVCVSDDNSSTAKQQTAENSPSSDVLVSGIDRSGFNESISPKDDLFHHVNGGWLAETEIPPDKASWGMFSKLREKAEEDIRILVEKVSTDSDAPKGSPAQKVRDFYRSYLNYWDTATGLGAQAIRSDLDAVQAVTSLNGFIELWAEQSFLSIESPFGSYVWSDKQDPDVVVVYLTQDGLTLPDRDYYLLEEEQFVKGRKSFLDYANQVFKKLGEENAATRAQSVLTFETSLAKIMWAKEENRDPKLTYNPKSLNEVKTMTPGINWDTYLNTLHFGGRDKYVVRQPSYFDALSGVLSNATIETLKDYTKLKIANTFAASMGEEWFMLKFDFVARDLYGVSEPKMLWKRAIDAMNSYIGELLGKLYVEKHFKEEAKERVDTMIQNLINAYDKSIRQVDWMSRETREEALDKLHKLNTKIGFPQSWIDYSDLEIVEDSLIRNIKNSANFSFFRQINKLDKPVDKSEWSMNPQTVNAYYSSSWNEIVFPAAILQPPFFNVDADDAVNYGGIGSVIGHEIGHAFDDQGSQYDGNGILRNWWTDADRTEFLKRKDALASQFDSYEVIDGMSINGQFTSGENLADLGGATITHQAYRMSLGNATAPIIDGWTGDQRVFLGYAQVWRTNYTEEALKIRLTSGVHSPAQFRVNGVMVNVDAFYEAFDVKEGDDLYLPPEERVKIWY